MLVTGRLTLARGLADSMASHEQTRMDPKITRQGTHCFIASQACLMRIKVAFSGLQLARWRVSLMTEQLFLAHCMRSGQSMCGMLSCISGSPAVASESHK